MIAVKEDEANKLADEIPENQCSLSRKKDIQVSTYFDELAAKEKKKEQRGSFQKIKISKIEEKPIPIHGTNYSCLFVYV